MFKHLAVYSLALFYGFVSILRLLFQWIKNPSVPFWRVKRRDVPPKCLSDPALGRHSYLQLKNIKLHYVENGDRSKPLMLFVHGFPEFWYSWRNQIIEFAKDYWVVAINMRGYEDSDKPKGVSSYDIDILTEDIRQVIEALAVKEKIILVAHDWGGVVAWQFLATYPQLVSKYVIMDAPCGDHFFRVLKSNFKQFLSSWYVFFFQLPIIPELVISSYDFAIFKSALRQGKKTGSPITDEDIEAFKYTFGKSGALTPPINYYRSFLWKSDEQLKAKSPAKVELPPGLLIFAENDKALSLDFVHLAQKEFKNLQTKVIPNANHFVQQDEPEAVNKAMRDFLK